MIHGLGLFEIWLDTLKIWVARYVFNKNPERIIEILFFTNFVDVNGLFWVGKEVACD